MPDEWTREGDPIPEGGREDARRALQRTAYDSTRREHPASPDEFRWYRRDLIPVLIFRTGFSFRYEKTLKTGRGEIRKFKSRIRG